MIVGVFIFVLSVALVVYIAFRFTTKLVLRS